LTNLLPEISFPSSIPIDDHLLRYTKFGNNLVKEEFGSSFFGNGSSGRNENGVLVSLSTITRTLSNPFNVGNSGIKSIDTTSNGLEGIGIETFLASSR
jgi:hypothetical protein